MFSPQVLTVFCLGALPGAASDDWPQPKSPKDAGVDEKRPT